MSRRKQARPSRLLEDEEQENIKPDININQEQHNENDKNTKDNESNGDKEDANNNESKSPSQGQLEKDSEDEAEKATALTLQNLLSNLQWPAASPNNLTLEALQNTKVAVAQFAANALAAGAVGDPGDLAVLQSTLFTLQQQQLLQLQLIHQIQQQLHVSGSSDEEEEILEEDEKIIPNVEVKSESKGLTTSLRNSNLTSSDGLNPAFASLLNCANQDPNRPLSPGLPPHQPYNIMNSEDEQPNTLEMLQKRAQEVLDSASQGLLASSLAADDPRKKLGPYEKGREPFFKHRCRYCGKVFGSDSALQIHIRSHTGERPFKCNVCGSRFTTKGNLKVHFQRHTSKFPHVKMNPHPVPEHLDAFHPPLLSGSNSGGQTTPEEGSPVHPSSQPHPLPQNQLPNFPPPPCFHPFSPLFRFDLKPPPPPPPPPPPNYLIPGDSAQDLTKPKIEDKSDEEEEEIVEQPTSDNESIIEDSQEQPENLSSKSLPLMYPLPLIVHPPRPSSSNTSSINQLHRPLQNTATPPLDSPRRLVPSNSCPPHLNFDPAKDPAIYTNLLPRPGSNDNAWESLIEVTKTSETSKLQQLVDNIEHKLTDPNQCIICHRVLSCKSALQMHYRTHTGERPFKCKICGRAFTTKGNLKTHMGVHRAKPPLRVLHQCPVCHKRFTNSLVLQQHIRLHTGEPTDLTPDQIRAAEVREPYPSFSGFPPYGSPHFLPPGHPSSISNEESLVKSDDELDELDDEDEDFINENDSGVSNQEMVLEEKSEKPTTSLAALENQVRTITTSFATQITQSNKRPEDPEDLTNTTKKSENNEEDSCGSSVSSDWKTPSFAPLDLTPRTTIFNPFLIPPHQLVQSQSLITPSTSALNSLATLNTNFSPFSTLPPPPPHHHHHHHHHKFNENESFLWSSRGGNTTCQICLKTFACNSALEIHYRSHTKERPFKCNVCERGFSTKGNMKQHMLTHKIRDATSNSSFDSKANGQQSDESMNSTKSDHLIESPPPTSNHKRPLPSDNEDDNELPPIKKSNQSPALSDAPTGSPPERVTPTNGGGESDSMESSSQSSKHICKVCTKNFSSSSALHIHSRTHTGDRPFKCNVCQKAFTTKGNLKVHMGTHIFSNGVSRRGRRMSLDPLSVFLPGPNALLQQERKEGPRRPMLTTAELFYPYAQTLQPPIFHPNGSLNVSDRSKRFKLEELEDEERKISRSSVDGGSPTA